MTRQAKKQFFSNLKTHDVTDNKTFWKIVIPLLTDKVKTKSRIALIEKKYKDNSTEHSEEIISDDKEVAEVFNKSLSLKKVFNKNTVIPPNFLVWKFCGKAQFPHSFGQFTRNYAETVTFYKISTPEKLGEITTFFTVIHSNISKVYERCAYNQIYSYFDKNLSSKQCGFRKCYNVRHCVIALAEKWKKSADNDGAFGALSTYLSKAFDCLSHELLIAKLDAYGFDKRYLFLIYN